MTSTPSPRPDRYRAAEQFLDGRINYERARTVPYHARNFKLDRMRALLGRLGHPEQRLPIVHVAGTKGKGSTAAMLAAVLSASGYRTGLFTSPHLDRVEERMCIDGRPCSADELVALVERVRPAVAAMDEAGRDPDPDRGPTYFEIITAMALLHFVGAEVDLAVLEVGLGGRLDSTNVCRPEVSVITSISLDHTAQLGDTLEAIAREKAGIVKPGIPVVSGVTEPGPREVVREVCAVRGSPLVELRTDFDFEYSPPQGLEWAAGPGKIDFRRPGSDDWTFRDVAVGLVGRHQATNAALAIAALDELRHRGWPVPRASVYDGLAGVRLPARFEVIARRPTIVIDGAHNVASVASLIGTIDESFSRGRRWLLFGTTLDKDVRGMLRLLLAAFDGAVFTRYSNNPRAVPPEQLRATAVELTGRAHRVCDRAADAWRTIRAQAAPDDLICVTGSFFLAAEMRDLVGKTLENGGPGIQDG